MRFTVVVFPLVPVNAMIYPFVNQLANSTSLIIGILDLSIFFKIFASFGMPGLLIIISQSNILSE